MRNTILLSIGIFIFSLLYTDISAQQVYSCDFEDSSEVSLWKLNVTGNPNLKYENRWYIGTGIHNGGSMSLYISKDGGHSPGYSSSSMMVASRDTVILPAGDYELSFDWLAGGAGGTDALFVAWIPERDSIKTNSSQNGVKPLFLDVYGLSSDASLPPGSDSLQSPSWKTSVFSIKNHDGSPHKLVFVWVNSTNSSSAKGACVDNILIAPEGLCDPPGNLFFTTSGNSVTLSWSGNAPSYEVKYYSYNTGKWSVYNNISSTSATLNNMTEGVYDFYVRSVCGSYQSHWVSENKLVYLPDQRCIDYLTLTNNNCWTGTTSNKGKGSRRKADLGFASKSSRHTLHTIHGEYDPRTDGQLPTIPPGELASVRLGNWDIGAEAECIEYSYTVDASDAAVLMLKYAVVFEDPNHDEDDQPRFELKVYHKNRVIDCANAVFRSGYDTRTDKTWHLSTRGSSDVWWKEWTTIGVNLADYDGETLKIEVTTYDCSLSGHYGYAYFTLGCSDGKMDGIACGDDPTTEFIAPAGFNYRWYLPEVPDDVLEREQIFHVDFRDTLTYHCDIIYPMDTSCYFTLTASAIPRYPVPEASYEVSHAGCRNEVAFTNTSHVMTVNQITEDSTHTISPCDFIEWDFGDGMISNEFNPLHEFPSEGGTFIVRLKAGISYCTEEIEFIIELPRMGTTMDTVAAYGCLGDPYTLPGGRMVWSDGLYNDTLLSVYDCDSIVVYRVEFMDASQVEINETLCSGESYIFDGVPRSVSGTYTSTGLNMYGCDSTTVLYLTVIETVQVELEETDLTICTDASSVELRYSVVSGRIGLYSLEFTESGRFAGLENKGGAVENPIVIPVSESVLPGSYQASLVFFDEACGNDTLYINVNLRYRSSLISQRWDDVLGILNRSYNGGYEFIAYQWYRNGELLSGETKPYLYVSGGLDPSDLYCAELTRLSDNVSVFTCDFSPAGTSATLLLVNSTVPLRGSYTVRSSEGGTARLYSLRGELQGEYEFSSGTTELPAPGRSGYYLLRLSTSSDDRTYYLCVTD